LFSLSKKIEFKIEPIQDRAIAHQDSLEGLGAIAPQKFIFAIGIKTTINWVN